MNYSTLLQRSVDFEPYAEGKFTSEICGLFPSPLKEVCGAAPEDTPLGLYDNYPNEIERPLIFSLMQLLWDRAEPDGYAQHMTTRPYANTPAHTVLLHEAFGDHQVANVATEVEARTIGARVMRRPVLDPGRSPDVDPAWGIPAFRSLPASGSALVIWDSGQPAPPTTNTAPTQGEDPHSHPRSDAKARTQKSWFLAVGGKVVDVCGGGPCYAHGYTGP
jgi:hypothetical protein